MLSIPQEVVDILAVGDVFIYEDKTYKLLQKTKTAVRIRRHYWFDELWDRVFHKEDGKNEPDTPRFIG